MHNTYKQQDFKSTDRATFLGILAPALPWLWCQSAGGHTRCVKPIRAQYRLQRIDNHNNVVSWSGKRRERSLQRPIHYTYFLHYRLMAITRGLAGWLYSGAIMPTSPLFSSSIYAVLLIRPQ